MHLARATPRGRRLLAAALAAAAACAPVAGRQCPLQLAPPTTPASGPPLAGQIGLGGGPRLQAVAPACRALAAALAGADVVLLGEVHDNVEHHRLQAMLLDEIVAAGGRPAVIFEMMDADQQSLLDGVLARPGWAPEDVFGQTRWARRGWPNTGDYRPLLATAAAHGLPVFAANLSPAQMRGLFADGGAGWSAAQRLEVGLEPPLSPGQRAVLLDDLADAHGGDVRATTLAKMAAIQQARDGQFAHFLAAAAGSTLGGGHGPPRAVLVAGADHTRLDRGVGWHLGRRAPGLRVLSVAMVEAHDDWLHPADDPHSRRHDVVLWTRPQPRLDEAPASKPPPSPGR